MTRAGPGRPVTTARGVASARSYKVTFSAVESEAIRGNLAPGQSVPDYVRRATLRPMGLEGDLPPVHYSHDYRHRVGLCEVAGMVTKQPRLVTCDDCRGLIQALDAIAERDET